MPSPPHHHPVRNWDECMPSPPHHPPHHHPVRSWHAPLLLTTPCGAGVHAGTPRRQGGAKHAGLARRDRVPYGRGGGRGRRRDAARPARRRLHDHGARGGDHAAHRRGRCGRGGDDSAAARDHDRRRPHPCRQVCHVGAHGRRVCLQEAVAHTRRLLRGFASEPASERARIRHSPFVPCAAGRMAPPRS